MHCDHLPARPRGKRIDLVGHSFGTHVIAWSIAGLRSDEAIHVHTVILSGSVLRSDFRWHQLLGKRVQRVINDCGAHDKILLLSQFFVLFTGMAGRTGFSGMTSDRPRNRFSLFGHSGYFQDSAGLPSDVYMRDHWVELLTNELPIRYFNHLLEGGAWSGIVYWLGNNAEPIKLTVYLAPFVALTLWIYSLYLTSENERVAAINERNAAQITQSRFLVEQSRQKLLRGNAATAIGLALEALTDEDRANRCPYVPAAEAMLYQSVTALHEKYVLNRGSNIVFPQIYPLMEKRFWQLSEIL